MSEGKNIPTEKKSGDQSQPLYPIVIGSAQDKPELVSETDSQKFPEDKQAPATKELQTKSDKPETETMEVHHHGHVHETKKWREYLFQFLMLFLAVFCGFLAEYKLEHVIEHNREKEYIRSLVADLKEDTANASAFLEGNILKFKGMDTLVSALYTEKPIDSTITARLYELNSDYAGNIPLMTPNENTMRQLLNSGNLCLLRKKGLYDSLMSYQLIKESLTSQGKIYDEVFKRVYYFQEDIFDIAYKKRIINSDTSFTNVFNKSNLSLITTDRAQLKKYGRMVERTRGLIVGYIGRLQILRSRAAHLLIFLKNEYHLQ